jgi:hypothetical protein
VIKVETKFKENSYETTYKGGEGKETYINIQYSLDKKKKVIDALERIVEFLKEWK